MKPLRGLVRDELPDGPKRFTIAMIEAPLLVLALVGHLAVWVTLYNQIHGRKVPRWLIRTTNLTIYSAIVVLPVLLGWWYATQGRPLIANLLPDPSLPALYLVGCALLAVVVISNWLIHVRRPPASHQLSNHTAHSDLLTDLGDRYDGPRWVQWIGRLPANQLLELSIHEKEIEIPRLPAALDGLVIAHLSDLHYTGHVGKAWFEEVVRRTDALKPDLIAVTGDIVDRQKTFPWLADTLGQLKAPHGVYFILGNHDLKVDYAELRRQLAALGLHDLGSRYREVNIRGSRVVLAGNELPWFSPAADMAQAPARDSDGTPLRILLAHSPDQFAWARHNDFDLMMAGHTHGGQFRLPWIGPVVTSSLIGCHYAAGTYFQSPTVMHVTRGLSGTILFRLNCSPELTRIVLRSPANGGRKSTEA